MGCSQGPRTLTLEIAPADLRLEAPGARATLSATVRDSSSKVVPLTGLTWSSSRPEIASVTAAGEVTGHAPATAEVRAVCCGGVNRQATIRVADPDEPQVIGVAPVAEGIAASTDDPVVVTFGSAVDPATLTATTLLVFGRWSGPVAGTAELEAGDTGRW